MYKRIVVKNLEESYLELLAEGAESDDAFQLFTVVIVQKIDVISLIEGIMGTLTHPMIHFSYLFHE